MINYQEISLADLKPNPKNPRKHLDGKALEELAVSIKAKGVIEPIIVRPAGKGFEIVAGERRYRASLKAGLAEIPAIVRELTDDEAYDFMLIENIQRSDLTDREEAESFKAYAALHKGKDGIVALAEKTGISPAYIRSRIGVLGLPVRVLKAWDAGDLVFGHLQQLVRIQDETELKETIDRLFNWGMTVKKLAAHIDDEAPALSGAFFQTKPCAKCPSNSSVQRDLFGIETKGARCLNPACFKKNQNDYLGGHWKETAPGKKCGTNGFRFSEGLGYNDTHHFGWSDKPGTKCKTCQDFVTVIEISGKVEYEQVCSGESSCFNPVTKPKSAKEKETGERDPEAPRAKWHGQFHRDVFLSKRIPEVLATIDPEDPKIKALLLACAIHGNKSCVSAHEDYSGAILTKTPADQLRICKMIIEKIVLSGQHVGPSSWNGFGTKGRRLVAEYLGIDLAKEFAVDKDYLAAKTKAEILAFGKTFKLLKMDKATKLKKSELVGLILDHGPKLVGKVPAEILK